MTDYVKQHYIPQFYLKHFCDPRRTIYCYDKLRDRSFQTKTEDIAQENYFYAIDRTERSGLEKSFGRIEREYFHKPYSDLIKLKNFGKYSYTSRRDFFIFLSAQLMRTNKYRLQMRDMHEQALAALAKDSGIRIPKGIRIRLTPDYAKIDHLMILLDSNNFFDIAKFLFNKKWITIVNNNDTPLWTSDNPIAFHNNFEYEGNLGIMCPGVEIRFPLTQRLLLFSYDPQTHIPVNNRYKMPKDEVIFANQLQTQTSTRFVYSP